MAGETTEIKPSNEIDATAFAASLFPRSESDSGAGAPSEGSDGAVSSSAPTSPAPASTPPATETPPEGSAISQEAWDALPKAWKKEMETQWKGLNPETRKYVHEREEQVTRGISTYKAGAEKWNQVTTPFQAILAQYPDANPADILATIAQNHVMMLQSTPEQRVHHAIALARGYGVELTVKQAQAVAKAATESAEGAPPAQTQTQAEDFSPGQIAALQRMLGPVLAPMREATSHVQAQISKSVQDEVDTFFSNPKNEFAMELGNDILSIMQKGQTKSLPEAYEIALLRNPDVKARYFAKLAKELTPPPSPASKLPNVKSSATPLSAPKPRTMDDTFAEVLRKHYS